MKRSVNFQSFTIRIALVLGTALTLACSGGGGGGGGHGGTAAEISALLGYQTTEGSLSAPVNLGDVSSAGVISHDGSVACGGTDTMGDPEDSYYLVTGIVPGVTYTVTLGSLSDDADVYVYQGDPTYKATAASRVNTGSTTETFTVTAGPKVTSFFVGVEGSKTAKGATFTLSVLVQPVTEGTPQAPAALYEAPVFRQGSTVGYDPLCTQTACGATAGDSFYVVTVHPIDENTTYGHACETYGNSPCPGTYLISLSEMTDDVDLYVFRDSFADGQAHYAPDGTVMNQPASCQPSTHEGLITETCIVTTDLSGGPSPTPQDTRYIIDVDGHYAQAGAAYTLAVMRRPDGPNYKTHDDSFQCNGFPCNMNGLPADPFPGEYFIRGPEDYSTPSTVSKEATGFPAVAGISGCDPAPVPYTGDATTPWETLLMRNGCPDSYYSAHTAPGVRYRLYMQQSTDKADLWVFGRDGSFFDAICKPPYPRTDIEACTFTASGTKVYFAVDGANTAAGASYTLAMMPALVPQGSKDAPEPLADAHGAALAPVQRVGTVGRDEVLGIGTDQDSYYQVTGLIPGPYIVTIPGMNDDVNLYVFGDDGTFTTPVCVPFQGGQGAENCAAVITGSTLYFAVDGFFSRDGGAYVMNVSPLQPDGNPDDPDNPPVSIGGAPASYFGHAIAGQGTVDEDDPGIVSFYTVSVSGGKSYRVNVYIAPGENGLPTNTVNLRVYPLDFGEGGDQCGNVTYDPAYNGTQCTVQAEGSTLYIVVDGKNGKPPFASYQLTVNEDASTSPLGLTLTGPSTTFPSGGGSFSIQPGGRAGAFGDPNDRYFKFTPVAGQHYVVTLKALTQDLDLYVFRGKGTKYSTSLCFMTQRGTVDEVCAQQNAGGGGNIDIDGMTSGDDPAIFISVDAFPASAPATFQIQVDAISD